MATLAIVATALAFLAGSAAANGEPAPDLHAPFGGVLSAHVVDGVVDYPAIAADGRFRSYMSQLEAVRAHTIADPRERLAFWINAYNALAIEGIVVGRSPSTFFGRVGYFKTATYAVGGQRINLYDLERKVLIPMGDPRIHFAINCASVSCPVLRSEAYAAARLEAQLDDAARRFVNDATRNRFDPDSRVADLSKIFDWFSTDFERDGAGVLDYVAGYVDDPALARSLRAGGWTVRHLTYDWSLNGKAPAP